MALRIMCSYLPLLLLLLLLVVINAAARDAPDTSIERNTLELEKAERPTRLLATKPELYAETFQAAHEAQALRGDIIHRNAPSSPFRVRNRTRVERVHETIMRDEVRVTSIHSQISRLTRTEVEAKDFKGPVVSGFSMDSGEYFTRVSVGTPARSMYLVLDTGSDILWLQCAPCINCYHQKDSVFDPSKSSTYSSLQCSNMMCQKLDVHGCQANKCLYKVDYGDGSFTTGEFATDRVTFNSASGGGSVVLDEIPLGCGHDNEGYFRGAAGLLGLGQGPLSFPNQLDPAIGGRFSYCLPKRDTDASAKSTLVFGDAAVPSSGARFTPQAGNSKSSGGTFYYLTMTGISVGGVRLTIPTAAFELDSSGNGGVIIDSGTSVTRLKNSAYASLRDSFRAGTQSLAATAGFSLFDTCFDLSGRESVDVPTVTLHFQGNTDLRLPAKNYLISVDDSNTYCLAFAGTTGPSIIGNIQQQGYRVIYDNVRNQIGFVPGQCDD